MPGDSFARRRRGALRAQTQRTRLAPWCRAAMALLSLLLCLPALAGADEVPSLQIYLLMGQSNMAGRDIADMDGQAPDPRILVLGGDGNWVVGKDPIHPKTSSTASGVGPGLAFARDMLTDSPALRIGLVPTAVGGTALKRWVKGGDLYERALNQARLAARSGSIRSVLWHQGESDAKTTADGQTYEARLMQMFKDLRADLGQPDLPIVIGQLGEFLQTDAFPATPVVKEALHHLPAVLPNVGLADSSGLNHKGDHLHFTSSAARELGRRFAQAMRPLQSAQTRPLWPAGRMPGHGATQAETQRMPERNDAMRLTQVSEPSLTLYPAPVRDVPAPAVIVVPGGGYQHVVVDKEGADVAAWLNSHGFTALVLKYRVPDNRQGAIADLQRALQLARTRATDWRIDPKRVGVLGFSAGGHLAARASTEFDHCPSTSGDRTDTFPCRPDFALLVYPAYLGETVGPASAPLVRKVQLPPILIVHTEDDTRFIAGSLTFRAALSDAGQNVHALVYPTGGHGYGLRSSGDARTWPTDALPWLMAQRFR